MTLLKNKKILITGHTGFSGTWLSSWLKDKGAHLYGYSTEHEAFQLFSKEHAQTLFVESKIGNICDFENLRKFYSTVMPDIVFHLAAQPIVSHSYENPLESYQSNLMGSVHLLECIRLYKCSSLVYITTDKVYQNKEKGLPFKETDRLGGKGPYSSSKVCAEEALQAYYYSYFEKENISTAVLRAGNIIGPGDWAEKRLIPDFFRAYHEKSPIELRCPTAIRPWQHVLDACYAYIQAAEFLEDKATKRPELKFWNMGPHPDNIQNVKDTIQTINDQLSEKVTIKIGNSTFPEAQHLSLDSQQIEKELSVSSPWNFKKLIDMVTQGYIQLIKKSPLEKVIASQIKTYENDLFNVKK